MNKLITIAFALLIGITAEAQTNNANSTMVNEVKATIDGALNPRSYRVGVSWNSALDDGFWGASPQAPGVLGVYEFNITPRFTLGIDLEYRRFLQGISKEKVSQLGYGLLLKHSLPGLLSGGESPASWTPYLEYGLLMNVSRRDGEVRSGTSHDTRLTVGVDFLLRELPAFADLSYHYSKLDYFDQPRVDLDFVQLSFGFRFYR